jgi:hypothetical protein
MHMLSPQSRRDRRFEKPKSAWINRRPPIPGIRCRHWPAWMLSVLLAALGQPLVQGQSPPAYFQSIDLRGQAAVLSLAGQTNDYSALEASTNLTDWLPLAAWLNTNPVRQYVDTNSPTLSWRFYRVREVDHQTALLQMSPVGGPVGTAVEILGRFFDANPAGNRVWFGGAPGQVLQASENRLLVQVPTNATTGLVLVTTALGTATETPIFVVSDEALVRFEPLPGMRITDFELATSYGAGTPVAAANATHRLTVNREMPALIVAGPTDPNRPTFFYAIALASGSIIPVNTASTAQALVFHHPFS